jgi:hypothetical protein
MKAYLIGPPFEMYGNEDARTALAIELISDIVFNALRADENTLQFAITSAGPIHLESKGDLLEWLRNSVDPNGGGGGDVRTLDNCRCVTFGYDGQAFLCLRHDDDEPVSTDHSLAVVEEISHYLASTDYFDGWIAISA